MKNKTLIISAFPGTGKSWFYNNVNLNCLDSDSSKFDKANFPQNYIEHIENSIGTCDIIFVSTHETVRNALMDAGIEFVLVYPDKSLKYEYLARYENRNNTSGFIKLLSENWDAWIDQLNDTQGVNKVILTTGRFINDIFGVNSSSSTSRLRGALTYREYQSLLGLEYSITMGYDKSEETKAEYLRLAKIKDETSDGVIIEELRKEP